MDLVTWAKQNSPVASMMFDIDETKGANQLVTVFLSHWPEVRDFIKEENENRKCKCTLGDYEIKWPPRMWFAAKYREELTNLRKQVQIDFYNLIEFINDYLNNTMHYLEIIDCANDFLELFDWSEDERFRFIDDIGSAKWRINPEDGEAYYKQQLEKYGRNEKLIGYYTYELLLTSRWDDAAKALEGFEDSTDQTIQENFQWLKERD